MPSTGMVATQLSAGSGRARTRAQEGTGKSVRVEGYEEWTIGGDGLIRESKGHYDEAGYQRQLQSGAPVAH